MPHTMPIKWTNMMTASVIMMSLINANLFFNKKKNLKQNTLQHHNMKKKTIWKW